MPPNSLATAPNLLSLSRLPLAVVLCALLAAHLWAAALAVFAVAALTDWLDGFLARRWKLVSPVGRALDPLTDKVLICAAFVYLLPVGPDAPDTGVRPWMVTLIVGREVLITGVRGIVEATGRAFAADWFGKLKTVCQCAVIFGLLILLAAGGAADGLRPAVLGLLYATLFATAASGCQYLVKAARVLGSSADDGPRKT